MSETWTYPRAKCVRVVDGDTYVLNVDLGLHTRHENYFRLYGLDTYETRGRAAADEEHRKKGQAATKFVADLLIGQAVNLKVTTHKDSKWWDRRGKYGRYLVDVTVCLEDGTEVDLADELRKAGFEKK